MPTQQTMENVPFAAHVRTGQPFPHPHHAAYLLLAIRITHALIAAFPAAVLLMLDHGGPAILTSEIESLFLFGLLAVLTFQACGIYDQTLFSNRLRFRKTFFAWSIAFGVILLIHQTQPVKPFDSKLYLAAWYIGSLLGFGLLRFILLRFFRHLFERGFFLQHAVILGGTATGLHTAKRIQHERDLRLGVVGFVDDRQTRLLEELSNYPLLGNIEKLHQLIREGKVHQVLVALPWSAEQRITEITRQLKGFPVNVFLLPDMMALKHAHSHIGDIAGVPVFNISRTPLSGWSPFFKRMEDLVLGFLMLLALSPLMLLIAAAIKLDSKGPVLFRQKRYGYNNNLIEIYKFRSMYTEECDHQGAVMVTKRDPRVTRVGRFLRKTSLDELPQLFNVLAGSMSLVGPRPHATAAKAAGVSYEDAVEEYSARHRVKPGITGWAQINGYRGETDTLEKIEGRVRYDLEYIENWSIWFDLYIIARTLPPSFRCVARTDYSLIAMRSALIIPTHNAAPYLDRLLPALSAQTLQPDRFLVIDSGSGDDTVARLAAFGADIETIDKRDFNHGGTRRRASERVDADILFFLTQDAVPRPDAFERLREALLAEPDIGAAYGRQVPHPDAKVLAAQARRFNYPAESRIKRLSDAPELGIKTCFCSDAFAAYRRDALTAVGGFPQDVIGSEDTYVAAKMLLAGWAVHYAAQACVEHSHNYSIIEEFRRYFDIGVFYGRERWLRETFGSAGGEGKRYVLAELSALRKAGQRRLIPEVGLRSVLKLLGYRLGHAERHLPAAFKRRLGMHRAYWCR